MTAILADVIGAMALSLLFVWLACSIICGWLAVKAGYQEKTGLATRMALFVIVLAFPKEGSARRA